MPTLLGGIVADAARRFGSRPAIVAPARWSLTYAELERAAWRAAAALWSRGVRPGSLVGLALPSSPDYLAAYLGAATMGAATVGVNPRLGPPARHAALTGLDLSLLVGTEDLLDGLGDLDVATVAVRCGAAPAGVLRGLGDESVAFPDDLDARWSSLGRSAARSVAVVLTSGTTGTPKAATFTEHQLEAIAAIDTGGRTDDGGPMLVSTELVHVGVMTKLAWYLRTGATLHLLERWRAGAALEVIERERIGVVGAISSQVALLLREPDLAARDLGCVRALVVGGGPSAPDLVSEARRRFGAPYSIRWSSTESGGVGTATAFDAADEEALHTVGRPRAGVAVEVRAPDGRTVTAPGEPGELWLRSPAVMAGYWGDRAATAEVLVGGWLRTNDLGLTDDRGCVRVLGRADDVIVRGGYNVHPEVVEAALRGHPSVADVAVVGMPDDVMGEVVVAAIVPRHPSAPPDAASVRAQAARSLAHHEVPSRVVFVDALPLTPMGKLDRRATRALVLG